jgi:hypothetical protein
MEFISFIKGLQKKGKIYHDVWLSILFRLEEKDTIELHRRLDLSKISILPNYIFWNEIMERELSQATPIELELRKIIYFRTETM